MICINQCCRSFCDYVFTVFLMAEHRHVGSNNFNLLSSRSHTIFTLVLIPYIFYCVFKFTLPCHGKRCYCHFRFSFVLVKMFCRMEFNYLPVKILRLNFILDW